MANMMLFGAALVLAFIAGWCEGEVRMVGGRQRNMGFAQYRKDDRHPWGSICASTYYAWPSVFCRELRFYKGVRRVMTASFVNRKYPHLLIRRGIPRVPVTLRDPVCRSPSSFRFCVHGRNGCSHSRDVFIECKK